MWKSKIKKTMVLLSLLLLQPMVSPGSVAFAKKKSPPKAYSFITEGGKASQGECDGERKIPRKLKRLKDFSKASSYMGSEIQSPEIKGKDNEEMWKHLFRVKTSCNSVLAQTPSSIDEKALKDVKVPELPPEEDEEPSVEGEQVTSESEQLQ